MNRKLRVSYGVRNFTWEIFVISFGLDLLRLA